MKDEIIRHYDALFGTCDSGYLCINTIDPNRKVGNIRWISVSDIKSNAADITKDLSDNLNTYYGLCLYSERAGSGRGSTETALWIPGFYIDLDFGTLESGSAYAGTKNPPVTPEGAKAFLSEIGYPAPSLLVGTGNGMHAYWLLDTPFLIGTESDRDRAKALYRGLLSHAALEAHERGWKLDAVGDLARIGRVPGTWNHGKPSRPHEPKPVAIIEGDYSVRYPIATLEAVAAPTAVKPTRARGDFNLIDLDVKAQFDSIEAGCGFIKHAVGGAADLSEPEWYAALGVIAHVENGADVAHRISAPHPGYDKAQTDWYLSRAAKFAPRTCADIEQKFGHPACAQCLFRQSSSAREGKFNSPIALGFAKDRNVVSLASEYAYDAESRAAYHRDQMVPIPDDSFRRLEARRVRNAPEALTSFKHAVVANTSDYLPGRDRTEWEGGRLTLNTYRPPSLVPKEGDWSAIHRHFELLFPDPVINTHILDYLAHALQRPGDKLGHLILILGGQGVGKTTAMSWMKELLGSSNMKVITSKIAKSDWTAEMMEKGLLVVEE